MWVTRLCLHARSITEVVVACKIMSAKFLYMISGCVSVSFPRGVLSFYCVSSGRAQSKFNSVGGG